ncbi:MAG: SDR family NAD(P)-dependent oxidoreductase [Phycisphaera sp.]|nr:SDR family NAD(P)-dependent oxidoreductase [Phycisphaera sp.]
MREPAPVAVITGAASGIGRACVDLAASRGWTIVVLDIDGSPCSTGKPKPGRMRTSARRR